ncbi:HipA N-terminal domain-containing protein [Stutzerimonas kunmingensis]|uniref:HipA N-terminal domain-containing protein n=1 Tax=Stutzerimonas kunmingensis TaxID=1211807 RepID=UPI003525C559
MPGHSIGRRLQRDGATSRPVQWYFDNLLPEEGQRTLLASSAQLDAHDAFALLAHYGALRRTTAPSLQAR